ncbi:MAG: cation-transporting P-type ATPase [Candidatus Saccharimonas sp.]
MQHYAESAIRVLESLSTSQRGLTLTEVHSRQIQYGLNRFAAQKDPLWKIIFEPFRSVFVAILLVAAAISIWHHALFDALLIIGVILISAGIYYVQRYSTEKILRSLQKHTPLLITVRRGGREINVDASELVPGDIILLFEGDKVPADARVIDAIACSVDESQLTGESLPIGKSSGALAKNLAIYEQANMVFQGSFVVAGEITAVVTATGNSTEFGKLATLSTTVTPESPVQQKIDRLVTQLVAAVGILALIVFGLALLRGMDISETLRFVIALSVSAVPEGLPIAISVVLVLGMRAMAKHKALVRNMAAIESIGTTTTIATDKTGTLTKNQLTVQTVWQPDGGTALAHQTLAAAILPTGTHGLRDPLDVALARYAAKEHIKQTSKPMHVLPFEHTVGLSGTLHHRGEKYELAIKGAPEHVVARAELTENERERITHQLQAMTSMGHRVIALAHTTLTKPIERFDQLPKRHQFVFDGFVAVADVLRPEARGAISAALRAGISVRMITGDHFETAYQIGKQLGLVTQRNEVFDSRKMPHLSDTALQREIDTIRVFSRVIPEYKHRILTLLKKRDITAMTGDGVNDVPALTNAHVGIAMGSGSSIAKDAGDIILLDDNFRSIIAAVKEGRRIYANITRMVLYLLATNLGEVLVSIGALLFGIPLPLNAVQLLWVNLVTDTSMVIPLGLERGEPGSMKQPPLPAKSPLLNTFMISRIVTIAITMAAATLTIYVLFSSLHGHDYARTLAFSCVVAMQWVSAFCLRSNDEPVWKRLRVPNGALYIGTAISVGLQAAALFTPLGSLLHVAPVSWHDLWTTSTLACALLMIMIELHKWLGRALTRAKAVSAT